MHHRTFEWFLAASLCVGCGSASSEKGENVVVITNDDPNVTSNANPNVSANTNPNASTNANANAEPNANPNGQQNAEPGQVEPIADQSFIYVETQDALSDHIRAFDVQTRTSRVVTELADSPNEVVGVALSPDRRLVAFASYYRADDAIADRDTQAVWVINADGSNPRRVVEPLDAGSSTPQLVVGGWSADGKRVYFSVDIDGGSRVGWVDVASGTSDIGVSGIGCTQVSTPAPRPGGGVGVIATSCTGQWPGIMLLSDDLTAPEFLISEEDLPDVDVTLSALEWTSSGAGFVFVASGFFEPGGPSGQGVVFADTSTGNIGLLTEVLQDGSVLDATISPDDNSLVYCYSRADAGGTFARDLYLIDSATDPPLREQLTSDGRSCSPSW